MHSPNVLGAPMSWSTSPDPYKSAGEAEQGNTQEHLGFWPALKVYKPAVFWITALSFAVMLGGYNQSLLDAAIAFDPSYYAKLSGSDKRISDSLQQGFDYAPLVGMFFGQLANGFIVDHSGYRWTIICTVGLHAPTMLLYFFAQNVPMIVAGQVLCGAYLGIYTTTFIGYASETLPPALRQMGTSWATAAHGIGMFALVAVRAIASHNKLAQNKSHLSWKLFFSLEWAFLIIVLLGAICMPESPWWMVKRGWIKDARHALGRLVSKSSATRHHYSLEGGVAMMERTVEAEDATLGTSYISIFRGTNARRTEIATVAFCIREFCGVYVATYMFDFKGDAAANDMRLKASLPLFIMAMYIVGTVFSWIWIAFAAGRRSVYLGGLGTILTLLLVVGGFAVSGHDGHKSRFIIGWALFAIRFVYMATIDPTSYTIVTEMPSRRLAIKTICFATSMVIPLTFIIQQLVNRMALDWGWGGKAAFFCAGGTLLSMLWTAFRLPDSNGLTFPELDALFDNRVDARRFPWEIPAIFGGAQAYY